MHIWNELTYINKSSLALGFFDGLHLGHEVVLKNAINLAEENSTESTVITFRNHPINILTNQKVEQILTLDEKLDRLQQLGINNVVLLNFENFAGVRANDYLENVLIKYFSPIAITTGFNHSFGYKKEGNSQFLKDNKKKYGYKYFEVPPFVVKDRIVSCSAIRNLIQSGNFQEVNNLLGYDFFIKGIVIKGEQIASKFGFPSANIEYPEDKIKIPQGVYYVKVFLANKEYDGILNYGYAPTIDNIERLKTEVHIIDFNENIYNKNIKISFIAKIRNQAKFDNIDKLKNQIKRDIAFANIYKHFLHSSFNINKTKF